MKKGSYLVVLVFLVLIVFAKYQFDKGYGERTSVVGHLKIIRHNRHIIDIRTNYKRKTNSIKPNS